MNIRNSSFNLLEALINHHKKKSSEHGPMEHQSAPSTPKGSRQNLHSVCQPTSFRKSKDSVRDDRPVFNSAEHRRTPIKVPQTRQNSKLRGKRSSVQRAQQVYLGKETAIAGA